MNPMLYTNLLGLTGPLLKGRPGRISHGAPRFRLPKYKATRPNVSIPLSTILTPTAGAERSWNIDGTQSW